MSVTLRNFVHVSRQSTAMILGSANDAAEWENSRICRSRDDEETNNYAKTKRNEEMQVEERTKRRQSEMTETRELDHMTSAVTQ